MPIKICHVTSAHKPFDPRIFLRECTSLAKRYDVSLIVPNCEDCTKNGVKVFGVSIPEGRFSRQLHKKDLYKKMLEVDADFYQFHEAELIPLGLKMKKKGKKVVFDSHEDVPATILDMQYFPIWFRKLASKVYSMYEKHALKKYDGVISVDPRIVDRLKVINPNSVMVTNFPIYEEFQRQERDSRKVCFTGNVGHLWLPDKIIESLKDLDVQLVLAGFTTEDYLDGLKKIPSWNKVEYKGVVPHNEAQMIQSQCIAGFALLDYRIIVGGKWGTLGNTKFFEYMMAGTPLIATDFILWKEIIDKYECGICVNPHNVEEITRAISYLQDHPEEVKRMGENGRKAAREVFNWSTQEKVLFDFYSNILAS